MSNIKKEGILKKHTCRNIRELSHRTQPFQESVIREMTRIGEEVRGVDLAQGLPDFEPPVEVIEALKRAIHDGLNHQYTFTWGSSEFREAVSEKYSRFNHMTADPDTEITITCGVSEGITATIMALTEAGDEVIIFEPWYENYVPACILAGVKPRFVPFHEPDYILDVSELRKAVNPRSRLILLNTPSNPSGRVLNRQELAEISSVCQGFGLIAVVDEIYEHIWYDEHRHVSLGSYPGMEARTVTLSGLGKSYAVTGWRVGWAVAAEPLTALIRKVHDYLTVCAPSLFQEAGRAALALPDSYYSQMRAKYAVRRGILIDALSQAGFEFAPPQGAYYVMVDASPLGWRDDRAFAEYLARQVGVIAVPGSSFYAGSGGKIHARLNFAKREETLHVAAHRLQSADLRAAGKT